LYWQGFYLYTFQIYADFSGYTDIARASALLLGFDLPENFQQPYLSSTPAVFWNRWHMTLTQWFREYLFFPVSRWLSLATGRRRPRLVQATANLLTMTLIGLWHGPGWTFVAWGLWHGVLLTLERLSGLKPAGRLQKIAAGLVCFHLVALGWVLFRADTFAAAARFVRGMLAFEQMGWLPNFLPPVLLAGGLIFALDALAAGLLAVAGLTLLKLVNGGDARPFIYGQF
jgi:D-alanyl-lipoteichoic acid acyltransferase DltB (MBOAT superfamily)